MREEKQQEEQSKPKAANKFLWIPFVLAVIVIIFGNTACTNGAHFNYNCGAISVMLLIGLLCCGSVMAHRSKSKNWSRIYWIVVIVLLAFPFLLDILTQIIRPFK